MRFMPRVSYPRRRFLQRFRAFLWVNRSKVALLSSGFLLLGFLMSRFFHGYFLGLLHGLLVSAVPGMILLMFLAFTGSIWQLAGAWGEDNTRDELKHAERRRHIWGSIHNIELANGDIDHLVITAGGVIAIDSKWHVSSRNPAGLTDDVRRATAAAAKAKSVLRSLKRPMDVRPVVVIWGAGQHDVPEGGGQVDGVDVVAGKDLRRWLRDLDSGDLQRDQARVLLANLNRFKRRVDPTRSKT